MATKKVFGSCKNNSSIMCDEQNCYRCGFDPVEDECRRVAVRQIERLGLLRHGPLNVRKIQRKGRMTNGS